MGAPQIIIIVLFTLNIGIAIARNGQKQPETNMVISIFRIAVLIGLLIWGGFFNGV
jgi:hypothetical protein